MNKSYELRYAIIDEEQAEEFSYGITKELISQYVLEHQEEFEVWQKIERIKEFVKKCLLGNNEIDIKQRIELLQQLQSKGDIN